LLFTLERACITSSRLALAGFWRIGKSLKLASGPRHPSDLDLSSVVVYATMASMRSDKHRLRIQAVSRDCIANQVRLLNRSVTAIYDEALRPHRLKISQMSVLVTVSALGTAAPGAVGRRLHMEKSTLSRNVDRMRARGWLEAVRTDDGRSTELRLTARGERLLREVHPAWARAQQRAAEQLGVHGVRGIARTVALLAKET
jgi:DNA-binding MarR family transcriptional regulator